MVTRIAARRDAVSLWPEDALTPEAEAGLVKELTNVLIHAEGYDPGNRIAQGVTVPYLHRPAAVYVAGEPSALPRYRIVPSAPEGQYTDTSRVNARRPDRARACPAGTKP
ncbi:hypothetical protein [Paraburkholderia ferrariae]|uniref:Uncharacterized protein n=1 Tax=Paraburkholderia ferrariae TaxID=386056 RepID=A0ABU9RTW5_9BURK